jgi:general L-amino acid transport system permease protein
MRDGVRTRLAAAIFLTGAAALALFVYRRATDGLEARGVRTGFGFLWQEAGLAIGQVIPLPVLIGPSAAFAIGALLLTAASLLLPVLTPSLWKGGAVNAMRWAGAAGFVVLAILLASGTATLSFMDYGPHRPLAAALATGFANTLAVSAAGIVLASLLGLVVGIGRLSGNWLVRRSAGLYVETIRNVPLLIQVFFWYFGVLRALPPVRASIDVFGLAALNNRGIFLPRPEAGPGFWALSLAVVASVLLWVGLSRRAKRIQARLGRRPAVAPIVLPGFIALAGVAILVEGSPIVWSVPARAGFNFQGGFSITPEFAALLLGLTTYTAAFIAEIVRAGIEGVGRGQADAGRALGLSDGLILRLVLLPQALRVMVPPLVSQFLSLIKDSSLGFAIAFPELVSITSTAINQTGQPIELLAVTIGVFMVLNLTISAIIRAYEAARPWVPT